MYQNKVFYQVGLILICLLVSESQVPTSSDPSSKEDMPKPCRCILRTDDDDDEPIVKCKFPSSGFKQKFFPRFQAGSNLIIFFLAAKKVNPAPKQVTDDGRKFYRKPPPSAKLKETVVLPTPVVIEPTKGGMYETCLLTSVFFGFF